MSSFVANQTYTFFIFILVGSIIGLLFDAFRVIRKTFKTPDIITYIEDVVFWILTCMLLAYTIFVYNNGELRAYIFIGIFIGIILYIILISKYVIMICTSFLKVVKNTIIKILIWGSYPIKIILKIFKKLFFKSFSVIFVNISKFFSENLKKYIKMYNKVINIKKQPENVKKT